MLPAKPDEEKKDDASRALALKDILLLEEGEEALKEAGESDEDGDYNPDAEDLDEP
jgi:hypothetical protein